MTDFVTALARLLREPGLREAFARDAEKVAAQMGVRATDRAAFERLVPRELEAQASVLLRKRFRELLTRVPSTIAGLGAEGWKLFSMYARAGWPANSPADALEFCEWLRKRGACVSRSEHNRIRFVVRGARFALHLVNEPVPGGLPRGQLLIRRGQRISEVSLRLGW